jgi:sugar O-acyltransferase (sialic acid O-acetyltransferase NeuD family)
VNSLLICGAGGHGRVAADTAESLGYRGITFVDRQWPRLSRTLAWDVVEADFSRAGQFGDCFVAIGNNAQRMKMIGELLAKSKTLVSLIHPSAVVSKHARVGLGSIVVAQAVVQAGTRLGQGTIVNTAATIDHDCHIGNGVHVSPGAHLAGGVTVGDCSWIGIGSTIREGCRIGENVTVAAGAVVVRNVADGATVFGVPAKEKF